MADSRVGRIDEVVRGVVGEKLLELKDPRLGFVTVTDVRTSKDLGRSEVFFTVLPDDAETLERTTAGLESAKPLLRREVGAALKTRVTPELVFTADPVPATGRRIEQLLSEQRSDDPRMPREDPPEAGRTGLTGESRSDDPQMP